VQSRQQSPVDLAHLARYTGGDAALDAEVLQLFAAQSGELLQQLQAVLATGDSITWRHVTHSLKGAARGIGAFALADAAEAAERIDPGLQCAEAGEAFSALEGEAGAVHEFIRVHIAG
jgi:HPt (histidine-containing phosphotransfer) domain-containing protein